MSEATPATTAPATANPPPEIWTVHTAESWARAIIADAIRFLGPATDSEHPATVRVHRLEDGGLGVDIQLGGVDQKHHVTVGR
jgi:hypothetical protein